jgi:hypothetical protein
MEVNFGRSGILAGFVNQNKNDSGLVENLMLQQAESASYNGRSAKDLATMALVLYPSQMANFKLVDSKLYKTPSGLTTYKTHYTYTDKGLNIAALEIWVKDGDGDDLYRLIFSADVNEYSNFLQTVDKIVDSLSVNKDKQKQLPIKPVEYPFKHV